LRDGVETVVEEFAEQILRTLQLPDGIDLNPKAVYRRDRFEPIVDIRLADLNMLPTEKSVNYVHARRSITTKGRSRTELRGGGQPMRSTLTWRCSRSCLGVRLVGPGPVHAPVCRTSTRRSTWGSQ